MIRDYITFCKDLDNNYKVLRASEQLKEIYASEEKYSKKQWLEDLFNNGYIEIKTITEDL